MDAYRLGRLGALSLVRLGLALGCGNPAPGPSAPRKAVAPRQVMIHYGSFDLTPDTEMVIAIRLDDLRKKAYTLAALSGVDHITFHVVDALGNSQPDQTVTAAQILAGGGSTASVTYTNLPLGSTTVAITAYDAGSN